MPITIGTTTSIELCAEFHNRGELILDVVRSETRNRSVGGIWSSVLVPQIVRFAGGSCSPNPA